MVRRLTEMYRPGDQVEIYLEFQVEMAEAPGWQPGTVVALDHPGVWVETDEGARWFVTNRRRIRPASR